MILGRRKKTTEDERGNVLVVHEVKEDFPFDAPNHEFCARFLELLNEHHGKTIIFSIFKIYPFGGKVRLKSEIHVVESVPGPDGRV